MKLSVAIFALFTTVAMAELKKVPRSQKIRSRQAGDAQVQSASMTTANGEVIPFDAANVYQASKDAGL